MIFISESEKETQDFLKKLDWSRQKASLVYVLEGELGSGKTTFVKGLEEKFGIKISSPTFNIMKKYKIDFKGFKNLYHFDFYRVNDLKGLNFEEVTSDTENLVFIEWGSNVKKYLPSWAKWIYFENLGGNKRKILYED